MTQRNFNSKEPDGPLKDRWTQHKFDLSLVNPANKKKYTVIVVGTGLAGASAAASLAELGYNVLAFSYHESPRRAHSLAAQGGINAAKNYRMMVILFIVYFMILLKAETIDLVRLMFID